jgi:hypothetical protein
MSLIGLVITLVVVGVLLWLLNTYVPMDAKIKRIINVLAYWSSFGYCRHSASWARYRTFAFGDARRTRRNR